MNIIILVIVLIIAGFIGRSLFDRKSREKTQDIVDGIRNEKNFWYLMRQEINIERVFRVYVSTRNQRREIIVGDLVMNLYSKYEPDPNDLDKKVISKGDGIRIANSLNAKIEEKEKTIADILEKNSISFSENEIRKGFENIQEYSSDLVEIKKHYDRFMLATLDSLTKGDKTGVSIWNKLKEFSDKEHEGEYDSTGEKHVSFLVQLKMLQVDINNVLMDLLCNKIENKEAVAKLKKTLTEWRQLRMLRWCVIDFSIWEMGKNGIQTMLWRTITSLFA